MLTVVPKFLHSCSKFETANSHNIYTKFCKINIIFAALPVTKDQLAEVANISGVLDIAEDFLSPEFRAMCEQIIPVPSEVEPEDTAEAYKYRAEFQNLNL